MKKNEFDFSILRPGDRLRHRCYDTWFTLEINEDHERTASETRMIQLCAACTEVEYLGPRIIVKSVSVSWELTPRPTNRFSRLLENSGYDSSVEGPMSNLNRLGETEIQVDQEPIQEQKIQDDFKSGYVYGTGKKKVTRKSKKKR